VSEAASELLMFQLADRVYGATVRDVRRIEDVRARPQGSVVLASLLGEARTRRRGIVIDCGEAGERTLAVDAVLGFRVVPEAEFRPLPAFAAACLQPSTVAGFAMTGEQPTVVIDLRALVSAA
jgi:chemotaxis signal transduction protein